MAIFSGLTPKSAEEEHLNQQINIDEFQKDDIDSNEKSSKRFKYTFHELVENEVDSDNEENTKNEAIANEPSKIVQSSEDLEILYENTQLMIHGNNSSDLAKSEAVKLSLFLPSVWKLEEFSATRILCEINSLF